MCWTVLRVRIKCLSHYNLVMDNHINIVWFKYQHGFMVEYYLHLFVHCETRYESNPIFRNSISDVTPGRTLCLRITCWTVPRVYLSPVNLITATWSHHGAQFLLLSRAERAVNGALMLQGSALEQHTETRQQSCVSAADPLPGLCKLLMKIRGGWGLQQSDVRLCFRVWIWLITRPSWKTE